MKVSKVAPILDIEKSKKEKKQVVNEKFDNDRTFVAFNSDMFRDHTNKLSKMALRNDGQSEHPIVFQYNGGNFEPSYLDIGGKSSLLDRSIASRNFKSQGNSPIRSSKIKTKTLK